MVTRVGPHGERPALLCVALKAKQALPVGGTRRRVVPSPRRPVLQVGKRTERRALTVAWCFFRKKETTIRAKAICRSAGEPGALVTGFRAEPEGRRAADQVRSPRLHSPRPSSSFHNPGPSGHRSVFGGITDEQNPVCSDKNVPLTSHDKTSKPHLTTQLG